jgi:hypothetical protein
MKPALERFSLSHLVADIVKNVCPLRKFRGRPDTTVVTPVRRE